VSIPYFPLFPDDFEADTAHLTLAEDGAYNRLLRLCWRTPGCTLPADDAWIMRRMRAGSDADKAVVRCVLAEFFRTEKGRIFSQRLLDEWHKAHAAHAKRVNAGSQGGKAKALKTKETASSNARAMPKQPEPEPYREDTDVSSLPRKRATRLKEDWVLPKEWGEWAVSEGWPESVIRIEADKFRDYWIAKSGREASKQDWQATFRNWMRNSKTPKVYSGGGYVGAAKSTDRLRAFVAGAD
jgi:uncharacterized protein YdaU (DUF1376 family)